MSLSIAVQPYAEPISVAEMKSALKQESDITEDDDYIAGLITAAREVVEAETGKCLPWCRILMDTTFTLKLDTFPACIELPRHPVVSVSSITYVDVSGVTQTLSASNYSVDTADGKIYLAYNGTWPSTRDYPNSVTVTFIAGLAGTFTADATSDALTFKGRTPSVGDRLRVMNSGGALPTGLSTFTDYFVIAASKLSTTAGGSAVDITNAGTGTNYLSLNMGSFEAARKAIKALVSYFYYNRDAVSVMPGQGAIELPLYLRALIAAIT